MIARRYRTALRAAAVLVATLAAGIGFGACDKVPLTAPTASVIQLFANAPSLPPDGTVDLVATVTEEAGTPVQNGTVVSFTTTIGRIDPDEARTHNGKVTVRLVGDGRSGIAQITAFSGGAESATIELPIGSAAASTIVVRAEPGRLGSGGGSTQVIALVRDESGGPVIGATVAFSTSAGTISPGIATTDSSGEARTTLTTTREATVTASAGGATAETTVTVDEALGLSVQITPQQPVEGTPTTFQITVTVPAGSNPARELEIDFGDGERQTLTIPGSGGTTTVSHVYDSDGTFTVSVTVTDSAGNETTQQSIISVVDAPDIPVALTASPENPNAGQMVSFTAAVTSQSGVTISRYDWEFGDGSEASTTTNATTHVYATPGSRVVRVTVIGSNGSSGTAQRTITVN